MSREDTIFWIMDRYGFSKAEAEDAFEKIAKGCSLAENETSREMG